MGGGGGFEVPGDFAHLLLRTTSRVYAIASNLHHAVSVRVDMTYVEGHEGKLKLALGYSQTVLWFVFLHVFTKKQHQERFRNSKT